MSTTAIQWTDVVWNCVRGCSRVSAGCGGSDGGGCYAERMAHRFSGPGMPYEGLTKSTVNGPRWTGKVQTVPEKLAEPLRWSKPRRIFVNSMSDLFHDDVPDEFIAAVFAVMHASPQHKFQVLTKRPDRMRRWATKPEYAAGLGDYVRSEEGRNALRGFFNDVARYDGPRSRDVRRDPWMLVFNAAAVGYSDWPLPNVMLGVSVEDQRAADERIPILLETPAAVRFLSCEPLLGSLDLSAWLPSPRSDWQCSGCRRFFAGEHQETCPGCGRSESWTGSHVANKRTAGTFSGWTNRQPIDWVICGGESGPKARPCDVAWIRSIVGQCGDAGVPVFVKQIGARPHDTDAMDEVPGCGRIIDGKPTQEDLDTLAALVEAARLSVRDRKGGDPSEWPEDLRVREFPEATAP